MEQRRGADEVAVAQSTARTDAMRVADELRAARARAAELDAALVQERAEAQRLQDEHEYHVRRTRIVCVPPGCATHASGSYAGPVVFLWTSGLFQSVPWPCGRGGGPSSSSSSGMIGRWSGCRFYPRPCRHCT